MDLLEEFRRKSSVLSKEDVYEGIQAAIMHVEAAERHLFRSRETNDDDLLNDVIYRTNQAFEGMLKEAYVVFTGRDTTQVTAHKIEKHLLEEDVFPPRVLELFTNYRKEWRNPSTHDHKLFFRDQEALLAIVNVTAFASILLDQMIETVNFRREKEQIGGNEQEIRKKLTNYTTRPFVEQVLDLLHRFSEEPNRSREPLTYAHEAEIIGRLGGFISAVDPSIKVSHQPRIRLNSRTISPDLLLAKGSEEVPVELKRPVLTERGLRSAHEQVLSYVGAGGYASGVVYVPPLLPSEKTETYTTVRRMKNRAVSIYTVAPESSLPEST